MPIDLTTLYEKKTVTFSSNESLSLGVSLLLDEDEIAQLARERSWEEFRKMVLLCKKYGIEISGQFDVVWYNLALALAKDLYPEPRQKGRKSKWNDLNKGALVVEVERLVDPKNLRSSVKQACSELSKREPWASFVESNANATSDPDPAEALRRVYFSFCKEKWAEVMRQAFNFHVEKATVDEWEKSVFNLVKVPVHR